MSNNSVRATNSLNGISNKGPFQSKTGEFLYADGQRVADGWNEGLTVPEDVIHYDDIAYGDDHRMQSLDVYRPKNAEGKKLPLIVSVHGGGWIYGEKERYKFYCMDMARRGFAVVNFAYRAAPEYKFPSSLEDTNSVFIWVLKHTEQYGFDRDNIFAIGDSAGAHILGLYNNLCTNPAFAEKFDFRAPKGFVPKAVALYCGVYKINQDGMLDLMKDVMPNQGTEEELKLADVANFVTSDFPQTFFVTCVEDYFKDQAPLLMEKLMEADVPFTLRFYGDKTHRLGHIFHCDIRTEEAKRSNEEACQFFRSFL